MTSSRAVSPETILELEKRLAHVISQANDMLCSDPKQAAHLCSELIAEASSQSSESRQFINLIAHLYLVYSRTSIQLAQYHQALVLAVNARQLHEKINHSYGLARSLNAMGRAQTHLGNFPEALENLLAAVDLTSELEDFQFKTAVLNNLGYLYIRMEEYEKALPLLIEGMDISKEGSCPEWQGNLLTNLCAAYLQQGDYQEALTHGKDSIEAYKKTGNNCGEPEALGTVGKVYQAMGNPTQALDYYRKSLKLSETIPHIKQKVESWHLIGELHLSTEKYSEAIEALKQALAQAQEWDMKQETYRCHRGLSTCYQQNGEVEKAFEHYKLFHQIKEEVFNEQTGQKLKALEVSHHLAEAIKDAEIQRLKNVSLQQEIEKQKQIQTKLKQIATYDPLTTLMNRRHFFELVEQILADANRFGWSISMIMLDIDHFKQINDKFGHLAGDQVLIEIGSRIKKSLRSKDIACRYGGEEFAVLLPDTDLSQAENAATRLWSQVTSLPVGTGSLTLPIGASLGVASKEKNTTLALDDLISQADQALYMAKGEGRNRVVCFTPSASDGCS